MDQFVFYRGGGFEVSSTLLRLPRKTYRLSQIEYVSVQRPLLFFAGIPAVGVFGLCFSFWRYLQPGEIASLMAASAAGIAVAITFGTLHVHSLALRDHEVTRSFGRVRRLRVIRAAVEQAMASLQDADTITRPKI